MAKKLYASVSGQTKEVKKLYCSVGGQTKKVKKLYASVDGKTKQVFPGETDICAELWYGTTDVESEWTRIELNRSDWNVLDSGLVEPEYVFSSATVPREQVRRVTLPTDITSINDCFLYGCYNFNYSITIPNTVTNIGTFFLAYTNFNHELIIPNSVTDIGEYFLYNCEKFNKPLTLPNNISYISSYFLANCTSFNQPLIIPNTVTIIGESFLSAFGGSFNSALTLPSNLRIIENNFLFYQTLFNQPLTLPSGVQSIGDAFMCECNSFNQPFTIPNSVTGIGKYFMNSCSSFNQPLTIAAQITLYPEGFMCTCSSMTNAVTLDCTMLGSNWDAFLFDTPCSVIVNTSAVPSDTGTSFPPISHRTSYDTWLTGTNAEAWRDALPALPDATYPSYYRNLRIA